MELQWALNAIDLINVFPCFYGRKCLEKCRFEFMSGFYERYDDIFVLFKLTDHLEKFCHCFNTCHQNMAFSFEKEKNGKMSRCTNFTGTQ